MSSYLPCGVEAGQVWCLSQNEYVMVSRVEKGYVWFLRWCEAYRGYEEPSSRIEMNPVGLTELEDNDVEFRRVTATELLRLLNAPRIKSVRERLEREKEGA